MKEYTGFFRLISPFFTCISILSISRLNLRFLFFSQIEFSPRSLSGANSGNETGPKIQTFRAKSRMFSQGNEWKRVPLSGTRRRCRTRRSRRKSVFGLRIRVIDRFSIFTSKEFIFRKEEEELRGPLKSEIFVLQAFELDPVKFCGGKVNSGIEEEEEEKYLVAIPLKLIAPIHFPKSEHCHFPNPLFLFFLHLVLRVFLKGICFSIFSQN